MSVRQPGRVLVVGGDGMIGSALAGALESRGVKTLRTTRRPGQRGPGLVPAELTSPDGIRALAGEIDAAVVCAGIGDLARCEADPAGTNAVNVRGVIDAVRPLAEAGAHVVCLSSSQVFDGSADHPGAATPASPVNELGRQKLRLEQALLAGGGVVTVVRLTKVLFPGFPLFRRWRDIWERGVPVTAFSDMPLAPVSRGYAVGALLRVLDQRVAGVVHVSGDRDVSYADAAAAGAEALGIPSGLVQYLTAREGGYLIPFPRRSALGLGRGEARMGLRPPSSRETIRAAFATPAALDEVS